MNLTTILNILDRALRLSGLTGQIVKLVRSNVATVIKNAEANAGKNLGDMTDDELAALLEKDTLTPDELIGYID
jgi:hypothetical protein